MKHKRLCLCSSCYKQKRKEDWKINEAKRIASSPSYLFNKRAINTKAVIRWREEHRDRVNAIQKHRCETDVEFRLKRSLRKRISEAVKNKSIKTSAVRDVGCSIKELRKHLESQFVKGMSWDNYGEWHIDHIIPLASFNLLCIKEFKKACHYSNLQPLWKEEHFVKTAKENGQSLS